MNEDDDVDDDVGMNPHLQTQTLLSFISHHEERGPGSWVRRNNSRPKGSASRTPTDLGLGLATPSNGMRCRRGVTTLPSARVLAMRTNRGCCCCCCRHKFTARYTCDRSILSPYHGGYRIEEVKKRVYCVISGGIPHQIWWVMGNGTHPPPWYTPGPLHTHTTAQDPSR